MNEKTLPLNKTSNLPALEGITLETIVTRLYENMGWNAMATAVPLKCFINDPSIKSSLKFLRRTPWARKKVEQLYLQLSHDNFRN